MTAPYLSLTTLATFVNDSQDGNRLFTLFHSPTAFIILLPKEAKSDPLLYSNSFIYFFMKTKAFAIYDKQESFILLSRVAKSQGINTGKIASYSPSLYNKKGERKHYRRLKPKRKSETHNSRTSLFST